MVFVTDVDIAAFRHFQSIGQSFGNFISPDFKHFIAVLEIEFIGFHFHAAFIRHGGPGLNAQHDFMRLGVFAPEIMDVVGGNHRNAGFVCQGNQFPVDLFLFVQMVIHQFDVEILFAEDVQMLIQHFFGGGNSAVQCCDFQFPGETCARSDQSLGMRRQKSLVRTGFIIKTAGVRIGNDVTEIVVSDIVFRQQNQVVSFDMGNGTVAFFAAVRRNIRFAADNRFQSCFLHGVVKFQTAAHHAVVGDGARFHSRILNC